MPFGSSTPIPRKEKLSVEDLIIQLRKEVEINLEACASEGQCKKRFVTESDLHRPGLALTGYVDLFTYHRIQILGNTECQFLAQHSKEQQIESFSNILRFDVPLIVTTDGNKLPDFLLEKATEVGVPVFVTDVETTTFMFLVRDLLEDQFATQTIIHGSMVDVYGIGILIAGKSGIGKSEVALDLVERGHRLVTDDVCILTKKNNVLIASASDVNKHFMEIRGLGIIDVMSMFGIRSIRYQKRLEVILELFLWDENKKVDRTGLEKDSVSVLGLNIPIIRLPITPGKNITVIAEVIGMNYLLSHYGYDAAKQFQSIVKESMKNRKPGDPRIKRYVEYFEGDFE